MTVTTRAHFSLTARQQPTRSLSEFMQIIRIGLAGEQLKPCESRALAVVVSMVLEGQSAEIAVGYNRSKGQRKFATVTRLERRDSALREIAMSIAPDSPPAEAAKMIATRWKNYESSAYRNDSNHANVRSENLHFWTLLRAGNRPISSERIRKILVTS
jgi:hypothetical protein